jgi:hypothetical protein
MLLSMGDYLAINKALGVLIPTEAPLEVLMPDLGAAGRAAAAAGAISLCPFRRVDDATLHVRGVRARRGGCRRPWDGIGGGTYWHAGATAVGYGDRGVDSSG